MIVYVVAVLLIAHGLANLAGVFAPWTRGMQGFKDAPWAFSNSVNMKSRIGQAYGILWLISSGCLIAAGIGVLLHQAWWLRIAISGCVFSLAAIASWWKAVPPGARFGRSLTWP